MIPYTLFIPKLVHLYVKTWKPDGCNKPSTVNSEISLTLNQEFMNDKLPNEVGHHSESA